MDLSGILGGLAPQIGGGLGGAIGKGIGSSFGPLGSVAGGLLGGLGGNLAGSYFSGGNQQQSPNFLSQVQGAQSNLLNQLQQRPQFQPVDINPYLQGARNEFSQQIVPNIAERFTGAGGQRSSGFQQSLGQAGSGLAQKLAELQTSNAQDQQRAGMQQQGLDLQQLGLLGNLQGQQPSAFNNVLKGVGAVSPLIGAGLNAYSGYKNRQNDLEKARLNAGLQAGQIGQQKQYQTVEHGAQPGFAQLTPDIISAAIKAYMGGF